MSTDSPPAASRTLPPPIREALAAVLIENRLALVVTDPRLLDNPIVHVSRGFCELTGYAEDEVLGRNCRFLQGPGTDALALDRLRGAVHDGRGITVELVNYRKNGEPFHNRLQLDPIRVDGGVQYFLGVQHEVSLPAAMVDDNRDILLRDLRHRVNGTLQLVTSLLRLRIKHARIPEVADALTDALRQLEAVMLVQRRLDGLDHGASVDAGAAIEELARSLVAAVGTDVTLDTRCTALPMSADRLEPLLLLANEAIANALRHAFPAQRRGRITVSLVGQDDGGFELMVADDGVGAAGGALTRAGLGTTIMHGFARQLGGTLELTDSGGVRVRLRVPPQA